METMKNLLEALELVYLRHSTYDRSDWHSTLHTHFFTEILYVLSGKGGFVIDGKTLPLSKGVMMIVNPYVSHTEVSSEEDPLEYLVLGVKNIRFVKQNQRRDYYVANDIWGRFKELNRLILKEKAVEEPQQPTQLVDESLMRLFMIELLRLEPFFMEAVQGSRLNSDAAIVREYIERHYKEAFTLDDLSQVLHLDKFYIIHTFKRAFGDTPMNYLIKYRIEQAQELLLNTDHSIGEIATITGFGSQSYFNQAFRRQLDRSPRDYRKQVKAT